MACDAKINHVSYKKDEVKIIEYIEKDIDVKKPKKVKTSINRSVKKNGRLSK